MVDEKKKTMQNNAVIQRWNHAKYAELCEIKKDWYLSLGSILESIQLYQEK